MREPRSLVISLLSLFLSATLTSPLAAQGGWTSIGLGNSSGQCVTQSQGWVPAAFLSASCAVFPGFQSAASASAVAGRVQVSVDASAATSNHTTNQHGTAQATAVWNDRLRWTALNVQTVTLTALLSGSTSASYNAADPNSVAFEQGNYSMFIAPTAQTGDANVSILEGVGSGNPAHVPVSQLSHGTTYAVVERYDILVNGGSNVLFQMALSMGSTVYTATLPQVFYSGASSADLSAEITGVDFRDAQGNLISGVQYSFDYGAEVSTVVATPEPSSLLLTGTALILLAVATSARARGAASEEG